MGTVFETIVSRRSIRRFEERKVDEEQIRRLITAAMSAPSANNQQPWHFIVVTDKMLLKQLSECNGGYTMLKEAPLAVLVCGEPDLASLPHFWPLDCSAATQNILLAAHADGLGAVWLGAYPVDEHVAYIRRTLNVPKQIIPFSLIALGYPAEEKGPVQRFHQERTHHNAFDQGCL